VSEGRVLIAEPSPIVAGTLCWLLREQGYVATAVSDHDALFEALATHPPDLLLLDAESTAGHSTLIGKLRSDRRWLDVRVIMTMPNSHAEAGGAGAALMSGADDFVTKPFRVPELLGRVRTQFRAITEVRAARAALRDATVELERAREDAVNNRRLVDILHEVTGELSATEIYRVLARRVARALDITHCSVVLGRAGEATATVAAAVEDPTVSELEVRLERYPEITAALETGRPVLVQDAHAHPLFQTVREVWEREGRAVEIQSVATVPFSIDRLRSGVLFLRTDRDERRLTNDDVDFAEVVVRAAVVAIRSAQALESTRADNRRLEALATTDPLTKVLNRRALLDRLMAEMDRAQRYGSSLSLLLLDVDHFKEVHDTAGHLAGDSVLRQLGALLEDEVRKVDIVARYGGEEFVAILPETLPEGGVIFAERLRERIAGRAFDVGGDHPVHVTVSIGIASYPSPQIESTEDLFARADEALYRAKSGGRNQVRS
jgi:two-component system, cell cycle response regulator